MNLLPIRNYLVEKLQEDFFVERMPETIQRGAVLRHGAGGATLDANLPKYKVGKFQIIVRDTEFQSGYDFAIQISELLRAVMSVEIESGFYVHYIFPMHDPISLPLTDGKLNEFSLNFKTSFVE